MASPVSAIFAPRLWRIGGGRTLPLGPRGHLMGIVNLTPDSFSDGGRFADHSGAIAAARAMPAQGASLVDLGAESTRPGAAPIDGETERARLMPVLRGVLAALPDTPVSVDTYRADTARAALMAGAHIVNDVWGLQKDPELARMVADHGAGIVLMHTGRERHPLPDPIDDQRAFLSRSVETALAAGIAEDRIVLDPGFGFAKDAAHNLALMARFEELHALGFALMAGTSRKRFIGHVTGREAPARDIGTAATTALLRYKGAALLRVHDVAANMDALSMTDAMLAADGTFGPDV
ncbi:MULTISPECIES: dihydropteroate synthase [unclassified Roseitalea]|uniref:dihydropteroate synthase n=1 Tax=unclassified Roseitalea TaxID=2639107 RepID=UPI00273E12DA|nr:MULTISPECIES: dihydropteroate synthase [unclassified Roseitalea]